MLAAPARIAATPSPKSRECWKPAVPPPPVAGAAVGIGLGVAEGPGVAVADGAAVGVGVGLALALGVLTLAVPLGTLPGVADPVPPGEIAGGDAAGGDPEQAETAAEANMARTAKPTAANLALRPVPITVLRIFVAPAQTCNGLFITGISGYAVSATGGRRPPGPARGRRFPRTQAQRYRLGEEQGER